MKRIIEKIILIFILISAFYITKVYAAGTFNVSASKSSINKGESVTVTIKADNAYGEVVINATNATVNPSSVFLQNDTKTVTVTSTSDEDIKVTVAPGNGGLGDIEENPINDTKSTTIKINKQETNTGDNGNSGNTGNNGGGTTTPEPPPVAKSTEARLSNLGIRPNDFSGFNKDKKEYSTEVPNSVSEVTVYADVIKNSKAKITSGTGKVSLKEGNNEIKVIVTAEAGNTETYKLTIKRRTVAEDEALAETNASSDANLKKLGIKPEEYDFSGFQKDKTEYSTEVPNDVEEIEVYAEASNSKAQINGAGMISLKEGKNEIKIEVIAENGTKKTYTIEVTRTSDTATEGNDSEELKFGLSDLTIAGLTLSPSFKNGTYEYTVGLREDLSSLEIEAIATDDDAIIEIAGNAELEQGENTITILVRNEKTGENATYQIIVNKNVTAKTEKMSWLRPSTWGKEEIIKLIIIAVLIVLIVVAVILKIKISKEKKNNKDIDFPGGEELDKAIAEHQELAGAEELNQFEENENDSENESETENEDMQENEEEEQKNQDIQINEERQEEFDTTNYIEDIARKRNYEIDNQDGFYDSSSRRKGKHF